jgi:hypothetical protein
MKKLMLLLGAAMAVATLGMAPAEAFTMAQRCVIANEDCFVMRASAAGMAPEERLNRVNERLAYIQGYESLRPGNIRMVAMPNGAQEIRVGDSLLVTVTRADARANGARNPATLGRIWLRNLRDSLPEARPLTVIAAAGDRTRTARR